MLKKILEQDKEIMDLEYELICDLWIKDNIKIEIIVKDRKISVLRNEKKEYISLTE